MPTNFYNDSIFWIEVDKIKPNPFQPRKDFDEARLQDLADSIKMYGVLQPLTVTRKEIVKDDGGLGVEYELISGERRLRASKLAGLEQVPTLIRQKEDTDREKLEMAIIENLQREDLNPVDRARAFQRLVDEFKFKHGEIGKKVGKSREYVSNTLRILMLSPEILQALSEGKIHEGHTRPILMLMDRPAEQVTLFKEILLKKLNVRESELIARKIAFERARRKEFLEPGIIELEEKLKETLGTRVKIDKQGKSGRITIDFFSEDDLKTIVGLMDSNVKKSPNEMMEKFIQAGERTIDDEAVPVAEIVKEIEQMREAAPAVSAAVADIENEAPIDDRTEMQKREDEENESLYSIKDFSV